jgi:hypothetical protein
MTPGAPGTAGGAFVSHQERIHNMHVNRSVVAAVAGIVVAGWIAVGAGQQTPPTGILPGPYLANGEAIYPAFEGWGPLEDGSNAALIGYYNRNKDQELDIPIGPNNHFNVADDMGQPTHFLTGRQWGVFAVKFPPNISTTDRVVWTLVANSQTTTVSFWNNPPYWVDFFKFAATGNTPPRISFSSTDKGSWGPSPEPFTKTYQVGVNEALPLSVFLTDRGATYDPYEGLGGAAAANANRGRGGRGGAAAGRGRGRGFSAPADVIFEWSKYRGPGWVSIDEPSLDLRKKRDAGKVVDDDEVLEAKTEAWFDAPGEYWLMGQAKDDSSFRSGGDQCCWSTTHVKVTVK